MSKDKAIFCIERDAAYNDYTYLMSDPADTLTMEEFVQIGKELQLKQLLTRNKDDKTHPS